MKAKLELMQLELGLEEQDVFDLLTRLTVGNFAHRLVSVQTGEWMYVFKPMVAETTLYVKLIVRDQCVVISFHEDEGDL